MLLAMVEVRFYKNPVDLNEIVVLDEELDFPFQMANEFDYVLLLVELFVAVVFQFIYSGSFNFVGVWFLFIYLQ